jgi:hypothetical protein
VSEQVTEALTATRLDRLRIRAGAGSLEVRGVEGGERVVARAWLCASDRERLFAMDVDLRRLMGPDLLLETRQADPDGGLGWGDDEYARIDLVLEVPAGMAVAIEDGSGTIAVNGVGDLLVRDGSGDVDVRDVRGNARIEDGSGGVRVARVSGDVEILDGTGSVEVGGVTGSLVVSGATEEVSVADVAGEVRVPEGALGRGVAEAIRRP